MIKLSHIKKTFRVAKREAGFSNAVRSFFSRRYENIEALADISFEVPDGETVGYIGPNGAGKSSTIKVMSGILTPDSGECVINGRTPWKDRKAHAADIGVVFGQRSGLWWDVPVGDSFELLRDIYSVPADEYRKNVARLTETLDLGELLKTPTRQLSLGQRMRCEIAAALIHSPKVLFLDEPTIGLDAASKLAVRAFVSGLSRERGTTVILTTHDMQDVEAIAKRIILIGKGRILLDGQLSGLKHRFEGKRKLVAEFSGTLRFISAAHAGDGEKTSSESAANALSAAPEPSASDFTGNTTAAAPEPPKSDFARNTTTAVPEYAKSDFAGNTTAAAPEYAKSDFAENTLSSVNDTHKPAFSENSRSATTGNDSMKHGGNDSFQAAEADALKPCGNDSYGIPESGAPDVFLLPEGVTLIEMKRDSGSTRAVFGLDGFPVSKLVGMLSEKTELNDISVESTPIDEVVLNMYREYGI